MIKHAHNSMQPQLFRVQRVRKETSDTFTLELAPPNSKGFKFGAGQFNMLYVYGVGEVPISISGDPNETEKLIHTTRAVGPVTKAMWKLQAGDALGVRGPFGTSWPVKESKKKDVVFVAGGIGLAPLRPALYEILNNRAQYGKVVLLYGTRTPQDILYRKELENWRARFDLEVYVTVDRSTSQWRGNVGVVPHLIPKAPFDPLNTIALVCGPEIMIRYSAMALEERGVAKNKIYISMERNMKCGVGFCGHCQCGHVFICKDGPVFTFEEIEELFGKREI
jgi:NAD(P)H-flavin reductase